MASKKKVLLEVNGDRYTIPEAIDFLGNTRVHKAAYEALEKKIVKELKPHVESEEGKTFFGIRFTLKIVGSRKRTINTLKAFKKLGKEKFLKVASLTLKAAKSVLSDEDLNKISSLGPPSVSLRTEAIPQASDMGAAPAFTETTDVE
jgi:hypothetical protein